MSRKNSDLKKETKHSHHQDSERPHFSKATMEVAKTILEQFEKQADEAFLVRAEMARRLSSF